MPYIMQYLYFTVDIYILHMQSYTCISWLYVG